MNTAQIRDIINTLGIEVKTSQSLLHPPLAAGCYCMDAATIVDFVVKIEAAVLAEATRRV